MAIDKNGIERCNQAFLTWNMRQRRNKPDEIVFRMKLKLQHFGLLINMQKLLGKG